MTVDNETSQLVSRVMQLLLHTSLRDSCQRGAVYVIRLSRDVNNY